MGSHQWRSNVNGSKYIEQPLCIRLWSLCCSSRFLHQRLRNPTSKIMNRSNMLSRDKIKQPFILLNKILVFITAIVPKFLTNQIRLLFSPTQDTNDFFVTNIRIFFQYFSISFHRHTFLTNIPICLPTSSFHQHKIT